MKHLIKLIPLMVIILHLHSGQEIRVDEDHIEYINCPESFPSMGQCTIEYRGKYINVQETESKIYNLKREAKWR